MRACDTQTLTPFVPGPSEIQPFHIEAFVYVRPSVFMRFQRPSVVQFFWTPDAPARFIDSFCALFRSSLVWRRVEPVRQHEKPVTLAEIKAEPKLSKMELIRQSRLSVAPVRADE